MLKIDKKIVATQVKKNTVQVEKPNKVIDMHEKVERPEFLDGVTYKIKTPLTEHALYITINDIILNAGTAHEQRRPYEIFVNSKNMEHYQWIVALTRIISAVFRKGGEINFLVEELRSVFDPRGGYYRPGGRWMPSLVAELGDVIETHLREIGLIKKEELEQHQKEFIAQKRAEYSDLPANAQLCPNCQTKSVIVINGCKTCLNCAESKCG